MTVKQLMENLAKCNPNATVCVEAWQEPEAKMIGEYIIDGKPYVYIGHDLTEEQGKILIDTFKSNGYHIEPEVYDSSRAFKIKEVL